MTWTSTGHPLLALIPRGLAAGGLAGLAIGLFALVLTEPLMDRAIRLAAVRDADARPHPGAHAHEASASQHHEELFSRGTQHVGLVVTSVIVGLALGILFALVYAVIHRRTSVRRPWPHALLLAGAGFVALSLLPGLRYPANPPGVGETGTVDERHTLWLSALVIGVLGTLLAWQLCLRMASRSAPARHLTVVATVVGTLAVLFLLPGATDPVSVPATLLWDFRMLSLASQALMWAVLGATFGALGLRAEQQLTGSTSASPAPA